MRAVADYGPPLVDDPMRLDGVATLGLDETTFLKATRLAPTRWVTGLVDLEQGRLLDVVADRTRAAVRASSLCRNVRLMAWCLVDVEQARASEIMRFLTPHDHDERPTCSRIIADPAGPDPTPRCCATGTG